KPATRTAGHRGLLLCSIAGDGCCPADRRQYDDGLDRSADAVDGAFAFRSHSRRQLLEACRLGSPTLSSHPGDQNGLPAMSAGCIHHSTRTDFTGRQPIDARAGFWDLCFDWHADFRSHGAVRTPLAVATGPAETCSTSRSGRPVLAAVWPVHSQTLAPLICIDPRTGRVLHSRTEKLR